VGKKMLGEAEARLGFDERIEENDKCPWGCLRGSTWFG
jgi:hypothetical protein